MGYIPEYRELQAKIGLIGKSPKLLPVLQLIETISDTDITVLIHGESGTGKEIVARGVHQLSPRRRNPMLSVNCGAIPESILESELFGHEKGSFTGATNQKKGYFEEADHSTLFLDEIGDMPLNTQVKLLRVLETGEFFRVGGTEVVRTDVRVIAASNKRLEKLVSKGLFREDLFFRLKSIVIDLPPLRERKEDLNDLIDYFIKNFQKKNLIVFKGFSSVAREMLLNYHWPGNIRELKNTIETLLVLAKGNVITEELVASQLTDYHKEEQTQENRFLPQITNIPVDQAERELIYRTLVQLGIDIREMRQMLYGLVKNQNMVQPLSNAKVEAVEYDFEDEDDSENIVPVNGDISLEQMEKEVIRKTLNKYNGNRKKTAQALNISERTLYRKIKDYGL
jgi:transcriptional regulator with PAS, ATPase and Fis domain